MKVKLSFFVFLLFSFVTTIAQTKTVTGRVTKENGDPLSGVTVSVKGTKTVTLTNNDGRYSITAPDKPNTVLVFTYVGNKTQSLNISGKTSTMDVVMTEEASTLNDVVVV